MTPPRRKKWTEVEEKTLIEKYGEMVADGILPKMKTREKKYRPIAIHVNAVHHLRDPVAYPWQWTWKDVSTKVQNMRHQYLLVKQKIKKPEPSVENSDEFDWVEGLTHWSNFMLYKDVFGDLEASGNNLSNGNDLVAAGNENGGGFGTELEIAEFGQMVNSGDGDFGENGVLGLGFDYDAEEGEENYNGNGFVYEELDPNRSSSKKKRRVLKGLEKKAFRFLSNQLGQLKEMEARFEQREVEREQERQVKESHWMEREREWERKIEEREKREKLKIQELKAMEKETEERERIRREEELIQEREWEERISTRRTEWRNRIEETLSQHRAEMGQMQTRMLHDQQNFTTQILAMFSQWTGHPTGINEHSGATNHYFSQVMQNLYHVNGMGDTTAEGDNQDDQFIVDG